MSVSINRNVPPHHRQKSGGGGGGGGSSPYIDAYQSGVGIFDPNHISSSEAFLYAEPTMDSGNVKYLKLRATLHNVISKLRKPFIEFQRYTGYDSGGAFMKLQPPTTDDSVNSFVSIEMTDPHKNASNNKGTISLKAKYFDSSGNSDVATISVNGRDITLDDGKTWGTVKITKDLIQIGSDNAQSAHIWLVRETGTKGNAGDINIFGSRVIINGNQVY